MNKVQDSEGRNQSNMKSLSPAARVVSADGRCVIFSMAAVRACGTLSGVIDDVPAPADGSLLVIPTLCQTWTLAVISGLCSRYATKTECLHGSPARLRNEKRLLKEKRIHDASIGMHLARLPPLALAEIASDAVFLAADDVVEALRLPLRAAMLYATPSTSLLSKIE